jgi:hypothetical protein
MTTLGLVLWSLKRDPDGAASTEVIARALPQQTGTGRTRELLEKAEDRGPVREVVPESASLIAAGGWASPGGQS